MIDLGVWILLVVFALYAFVGATHLTVTLMISQIHD